MKTKMSDTSRLKKSTALTSLTLAAALAMPAAAQAPQPAAETQGETIEEVVITGTYIRRRSQANTPSPIQVIGQESIRDIGAQDIADITQTLTINNGAQNNPDAFTQNLTTGTSNVNLRGLGVSSTLVLLNSKRQVNSAAPTDGGLLFVDTASIMPLIAIERLEILEDGAAALYGTDAVAGVVNFITRADFEGLELDVDFQAVTEHSANDVRVSGLWGGGNDRTHMIVAASFLERTPLTTAEKELRPEAFRGPFGLSVSTLTAQPGNFVVPAIPQDALAQGIVDPALAGTFFGNFDSFTPFAVGPGGNVLTDPDGNPIPNIDSATGQFLGFNMAPDTIADGLTSTVLGGLGVPSFILDQISAAQAQLAADPQANPSFATPTIGDPTCEAATQQADWIIPAVDPVTGVQTCQYDFYPFFNFTPDENRLKGFAQIRHEITDFAEFYGEVAFSRNRIRRATSNFPITSTIPLLGIGSAFVEEGTVNPITGVSPAAYPFNPFGVDTLYIGRSPGVGQVDEFFTDRPNDNTFEHDTYRFVAGLRGDLVGSWYYDVSYVRGINDYELRSSDGLANETNLALNGLGGEDCDPLTGIPGVGPCQFYNITGSGALADPGATAPVFDVFGNPIINPATGQQVLAPVRNSREILDFINGEIRLDGDSDLTVIDGVVSGETFELPGGPIGLALGAQYRDQRLAHDLDDNTNAGNFLFVTVATLDFDASRDVYAVFGEIALPILDNLEINGALRFEDYGSNVGDTLDPKVSALYRPLDWITLRASWGTSFRAPSLFQQFGTQTTLNSVRDPRTGNSSFFAIRSLGDEDLQPEESEAFNVGFTIEPIDNLELNADYWRFEFEDVIIQEDPDQLAAEAFSTRPELLGTQVFLDPNTGALVQINSNFVNAAFINTDGIDFGVNYTIDTDFGIFQPGFEATWVNEYELPLGPDGSGVDVVDRRNRLNFGNAVVDWRANARLTWMLEGHQANVYVRYIDSFLDDENTVFETQPNGLPNLAEIIEPREVDEQITVDVQYSYTFEGLGPVDYGTVTVGAINLFNEDPPFVETDGAFASRVHDPRGRLAYVRLRLGF